MKNWTTITTVAILCFSILTACAAPSPTPSATFHTPSATPNPTPSIITPRNVSNIIELKQLGKGALKQVVWSPDGKKLITASSIGIHFYDTETFKEISFIHNESQIDHIALSFDGSMLATGGFGLPTQLWDTNTGHLLKTLGTGATSLAFSPDGYILATGGMGIIRL